MFAIDYPYEFADAATSALSSAALSQADHHKIAYSNAERALKVESCRVVYEDSGERVVLK